MNESTGPGLVLVGAGLQNTLIALAALDAEPGARIEILERAARPCGNHTWSFHATDVPPPLEALMATLAEHTWPDYDVRFPGGERRVGLGYATMGSEHLAATLERRLASAPNARFHPNAEVTSVDARGATLADGRRIEGELVIDARGPRLEAGMRCGYQKFYGVELRVDQPHGLERPLLMDATLEQVDGFRFLYVLPLGPTRLLVEDTVFSTQSELDSAAWRARVLDEARAQGWHPVEVLREEQGVLPMPWVGAGPSRQGEGPLRGGYRGGWFHPATGYSAPHAMRLATIVARHMDAPGTLFETDDYKRFVKREIRQARFARFLNRLLFTAVRPQTRWTIFERFYRHPEPLIARFYACALTPADRARMLVGRPPRGFSLAGALTGKALR